MKITSPFLLLMFLLLLLLPSFQNAVYATKSDNFKVRGARHNSKLGSKHSSTPQEEKKVYKRPSGPNPVGNFRPPSRR
ncbi:CLAVATA3/ESR (CLE)-related protein 46 isoform X2 [Cynara cardunculus var. scolymus]|uniref:CLAVATA3/ESR (CLE)-related protein 46 isoform X2 n=1 Tax=Cynara cardunculus var. scolymus TaxID=59895 RepID=UPI000D6233D7|nr:CLAVATA3/ESR (CLE)-related protein 46 isoform X2 [Cynara cardunculus var. scolymus]